MIHKEVIEQKETLDQDKLLEGIDCPVRVIHGAEDEVVPIESSKRAAKKLQKGEIVEIEGLDHGYNKYLDEVEKFAVEFFSENIPVSET